MCQIFFGNVCIENVYILFKYTKELNTHVLETRHLVRIDQVAKATENERKKNQ